MTSSPTPPILPSQQVSVDSGSQVNPVWYEYLSSLGKLYKYITTLQPLGDLDETLALKSNILRDGATITTTTYTFALADSGGYRRFVNASPITVTVPPHSSVPFEAWTQIDGGQFGDGQLHFAEGSGVHINSLGGLKSLSGNGAPFTLIQTDTIDTWDLVGGLSS